jgi:hypothetical protein
MGTLAIVIAAAVGLAVAYITLLWFGSREMREDHKTIKR